MYASGSPARRRATSSSNSAESNRSSRRAHNSLRVMPSTCAASSSVSWRGSSVRSKSELQLTQRLDDGVEVSVHHLLDAVHRDADAMIRHAVLREVVRPDLLGTVTGAHLRTAFCGHLRMRLLFGERLEP